MNLGFPQFRRAVTMLWRNVENESHLARAARRPWRLLARFAGGCVARVGAGIRGSADPRQRIVLEFLDRALAADRCLQQYACRLLLDATDDLFAAQSANLTKWNGVLDR